MKTTHFNKQKTAESMNETLQQKFGQRLDIQNFSVEQLKRANSLIESKLSEIRKTKFNETLTNEEFHRLKMMHDVVKTALEERAVSKIQQRAAGAALDARRKGTTAGLKGASKKMSKMSTKELEKLAGTKHKEGLPEKKKKTESVSEAKKSKNDGNLANNAKPYNKITKADVVAGRLGKDEMGGNGKKESMSEAINRLVTLTEGEEAKAEIIMSVRNMVDRFTAWGEDIAKMQAQTVMELADEIRDQLGQETAEMFIQQAEPALASALENVKNARESLNGTITVLTGESSMPMGAEPEEEAPAPEGGEEMPPEEEEAPAPEGGEEKIDIDLDELPPEPEGRAKRESIEQRIRITRMLVGS